jgi:hypothetical protein
MARAAAVFGFSTSPALAIAQAPAPAAPPAPIAWSQGPALEQGRDHHAVFATDDRVFVAGGTDYRTVFADVWSARVRVDGGLEGWTRGPDLPGPRAGAAAVAVDGLAVLVSGQLPDRSKTADVFTARIAQGGTLEAWAPAPPLPAARFHHAAAAHGSAVYVTGGQGATGSEASVYMARVEGGRLSAWTELTPLPRPRSHHASLVHGGYLYVVAGLDGNPAAGPALLNDVRRAAIREDGTLGEWELASIMPHAYGTHSALVHGGFLYVLGGVEDNSRFVDAVWRAPFREDGRLGAWEAVAPGLPAARGHVHVTPVIGGRVYSVGGSANRQVRANVDVGVLPAAR